MVTQLHQTTPEQDAHQRLRESVQRIVLEETQGGRRIVRSVVSIMEGDAPGSTPLAPARARIGNIHKQRRKPPLNGGSFVPVSSA